MGKAGSKPIPAMGFLCFEQSIFTCFSHLSCHNATCHNRLQESVGSVLHAAARRQSQEFAAGRSSAPSHVPAAWLMCSLPFRCVSQVFSSAFAKPVHSREFFLHVLFALFLAVV